MIASPGDVTAERKSFRTVVDKWNALNASNTGIVLMPLGWETHASPAVGRPQGVISSQVLSRADLLVVVFHNRFGTPTGQSKSGTLEELVTHARAGRPAMIYFSDRVTCSRDAEQRAKVDAFRNRIVAKKLALVEKFVTLPQFEEKLSRHLHHQVMQHFGTLTRGAALLADRVVVESTIGERSTEPNDTELVFAKTANTRRRLKRFIEKLDKPRQVVIVLYYFESMTFSEIATTMDTSERHVSTLHKSALTSIRDMMHS